MGRCFIEENFGIYFEHNFLKKFQREKSLI